MRATRKLLSNCPEEGQGHGIRDDDCTVVHALTLLQESGQLSPLERFDPEVLAERLRDVAASNYETAMAFGISRDSFERCANDAARVTQDMTTTTVPADVQDAARWRAYVAQFPEISAAFVAVHGDPVSQGNASAASQELCISTEMIRSARDAYNKAPFPHLNKWRRALDAALQIAVHADQKRMRVTAAMVRVARDAYDQAPLPEENCWNCALRAAFVLRQER